MVYDDRYINKKSGYSVIFEDDGRVAYAYLLDPNDKIVADVWLYNRCPTPAQPEWSNPDGMPFANPEAFVKDHTHLSNADFVPDVSIEWPDSPITEARLYIQKHLFAVLIEGIKPGWSHLAKKDGPLAKTLDH